MNTRSTRLSPIAVVLAACALAMSSPNLRADTPDAYLDYVASTGSQYIDTGVIGKSGTRMVAEMEWVAKPSVQSTFCGAYDGSENVVTPYTSAGESHQVGYAKNSQYQVGGSGKPNPNIRFRVETTLEVGSQSFNVRALDGSGYNATRTYNDSKSVDLGCSLYLFARNDSGTANQYSSARIFSVMFWQKDGNGNWQLVRHFLPCRKGGRAALYDKVEGTIHFPQGGDLEVGETLPRPLDFVQWVQSDGASGDRQLYIDTGVPGKVGTGMTAELLWPAKPSAASTVCGAMADSTHHFTLYTSAGTHQIGYANYSAFQVNTGTSVVYPDKRYRVTSSLTKSAQNLQVEDLDGTGYNGSRFFNDANSIDAGRTLYLFARNDAGTPNQFSRVRLYSLMLTNEVGVLRDFIPCVADNGKAGLYDRVSERVFFPKAIAEGATAEFSLATEVGAVTNRSVTAKWPSVRPEYIESNGTNDYVDLGITARDGTRMVAEVEWNDLPAAATFCGAATNTSSGLFTNYRITTGDGSNYHRMGYYNGYSTLSGGNGAPVAGVRYRVETSLKNGEQIISVKKFDNGTWSPVGDGTRTVNLSFPAGFANLGMPLYLFACNLNGRPYEFAPARLYSFKLWQDGSLVRDIRPAYHPVGNTPALFDRMNEVWYFNDGGYGFEAGGETKPFPGRGTLILVL